MRITAITLEQLEEIWRDYGHFWLAAGPFMTPAWLRAWWSAFGADDEPLLLLVERDGEVLGVAPLQVDGQSARLIGSDDVCDHLDFLVRGEHAENFYTEVLAYLEHYGITELFLQPVRLSSSVLEHLIPTARKSGRAVEVALNNVYLDMALPTSWQEYLGTLTKKQRHEVRRKFRRFTEAGELGVRTIREPRETLAAMETFFQLFRLSRADKDDFMVAGRQRFFQELAKNLATSGMLELQELSLDGKPMAMVFCFDHGSTTYLYNNGFDLAYRSISPGIVSKAMAIRKSIQRGMSFFNFLNGDERYKYQLGGSEQSLFSCRVALKKPLKSYKEVSGMMIKI